MLDRGRYGVGCQVLSAPTGARGRARRDLRIASPPALFKGLCDMSSASVDRIERTAGFEDPVGNRKQLPHCGPNDGQLGHAART